MKLFNVFFLLERKRCQTQLVLTNSTIDLLLLGPRMLIAEELGRCPGPPRLLLLRKIPLMTLKRAN
jgi:hypothetical protein